MKDIEGLVVLGENKDVGIQRGAGEPCDQGR